MTGKVARWANAHGDLWRSHPVKGDIGLVFVPESETFNYVQQGSTDFYAQSIRGAYQGFFDNNIQADFVHIDDIRQYPAIYLPYPRLHAGPGGVYLYVVNPDRAPRRIEVTLPSAYAVGDDIWGGQKVAAGGNSAIVTVEDRDAAVIHLRQ